MFIRNYPKTMTFMVTLPYDLTMMDETGERDMLAAHFRDTAARLYDPHHKGNRWAWRNNAKLAAMIADAIHGRLYNKHVNVSAMQNNCRG